MELARETAAEAAPDWGAPPWRIDVAVPRAPLPEHAEIAVVGAGFTGLAAALACARRGACVHVLEARGIGAGASGRSGGIALEGTAAGPRPGAEACLAALESLIARNAIECDLELRGCWRVRHLAGAATPPPRPAWPDADGAWIVRDGEEPGGALDPGKLVAGLASAALRAGAVLHEGTPVASLEPGPPCRLRVGDRTLVAERVVLALNGFLPAFVPEAGIRPALTLALATAPLGPDALAAIGLGATPFYTADLPYLWGRATHDGRLVIGAGLAFDPEGRVDRVAIGRDDVRVSLERVAARVRGLHPALAGVPFAHAWGGPIAFRAGGVPVVAEIAPGVLAMGACAGHGVALSAVLGDVAASWAREGVAPPPWGAAPAGAGAQ
jgi:gamma-glutamylputrescine oxidase